MSIYTTPKNGKLALRCDQSDCKRRFYPHSVVQDEHEVRMVAKRQGWRNVDNRDLCPAHRIDHALRIREVP